jgi:hypothetical protein
MEYMRIKTTGIVRPCRNVPSGVKGTHTHEISSGIERGNYEFHNKVRGKFMVLSFEHVFGNCPRAPGVGGSEKHDPSPSSRTVSVE